MARQDEIAEIHIDGKKYRDWTSVRVEMDFTTMARTARFSCVEDLSRTATYQALQIKPDDKGVVCQVYLAGELVMTGHVFNRQVGYNATMHGVMISAMSRTGDAVSSSPKLEEGQFRGYSFEAIGKKVLQPFGLNLKIKNPPEGFDKKFRDVSVYPGETVFSFLERLARMRGVWLQDDENGDVVATQIDPQQGAGAQLQEGRNILSANCVIDNQAMFSNLAAFGSHQGHDQSWGDDARGPAADVQGESKRYRPSSAVMPDQADDAEDVRRFLAHERNFRGSETIECVVTVQGWKKDQGGGLWKMGETVSIRSPMLLLDHDLAIKTVTFGQDDSTGTTTTMTLVKPEHLSGALSPSTVTGQGGLLPGTGSAAPQSRTY